MKIEVKARFVVAISSLKNKTWLLMSTRWIERHWITKKKPGNYLRGKSQRDFGQCGKKPKSIAESQTKPYFFAVVVVPSANKLDWKLEPHFLGQTSFSVKEVHFMMLT